MLEAAAVASPDERRGTIVKAFIVLTEGNGARQILKQGDITPIRSIIVGIVDHVEA